MRRVRSWGYLERSPKEAASGFGAEGDAFKADHSRIFRSEHRPARYAEAPSIDSECADRIGTACASADDGTSMSLALSG
jgi:hypothetical protein